MKKNNQKKTPKYRNKIILIISIVLLIPSLFYVAKNSKQIIEDIGFGSKKSIQENKHVPQKLQWFNDFKGIDNMGNNK